MRVGQNELPRLLIAAWPFANRLSNQGRLGHGSELCGIRHRSRKCIRANFLALFSKIPNLTNVAVEGARAGEVGAGGASVDGLFRERELRKNVNPFRLLSFRQGVEIDDKLLSISVASVYRAEFRSGIMPKP
jgi:hypothetical protein